MDEEGAFAAAVVSVLLAARAQVPTRVSRCQSRSESFASTKAAYGMPDSRLIYRVAVGLFTRLRLRQARRAGVELG